MSNITGSDYVISYKTYPRACKACGETTLLRHISHEGVPLFTLCLACGQESPLVIQNTGQSID
jgi:hypothetical protein